MFFLIFKILIQYNIIFFFLHIIKVLYLKGFFVVVVVFLFALLENWNLVLVYDKNDII